MSKTYTCDVCGKTRTNEDKFVELWLNDWLVGHRHWCKKCYKTARKFLKKQKDSYEIVDGC